MTAATASLDRIGEELPGAPKPAAHLTLVRTEGAQDLTPSPGADVVNPILPDVTPGEYEQVKRGLGQALGGIVIEEWDAFNGRIVNHGADHVTVGGFMRISIKTLGSEGVTDRQFDIDDNRRRFVEPLLTLAGVRANKNAQGDPRANGRRWNVEGWGQPASDLKRVMYP